MLKNMVNDSYGSSDTGDKHYNKTNNNKIECIFFTTYSKTHGSMSLQGKMNKLTPTILYTATHQSVQIKT